MPTTARLSPTLASLLLLSATHLARAADLFPPTNAKDISPDVQLKIQFPSAPALATGKIQIFDANDTLIEAIDLATPTLSQPMAGTPQKYYPVTISGNEATIHPKLHELAYGKSYYVTLDAGVFKLADAPSPAIDKSAWQFSTRAAAPKPSTKITIAPDNSADFCTLQAALDFIPDNNTVPTSIFLKKGTYTEMIFLRNKNNITLIGEDRKNSVIAYSNTAPLNGGRRSVMRIDNCADFVLANLTVWNTTARLSGGNQAETIIYAGNLNSRAVLNKVDLKSFQDTLQINDQAFLSDCYIEGDIDFMWGSGCVFFDNITAKMLTGGNDSYVETRTPASNHGFVYYHSTFTSVPGITGNYIAQSAGSAEVVLLDCTLGDNIRPLGWRVNAGGGGGGAPRGRGAPGRGVPPTTTPAGTPPTVPANAPAPAGRNRGAGGGGGAPALKYLEFNSHTPDGKPVDMSLRAPESKELKQPADADTIANYSNPVWVLGNTWVPMVPANNPRPTLATIKPNAPLNFTPTFNFSPDATYQWQKDGKDIPNATTALYQIKSATPADAGTYTVTIKNGPDSTTSAPATIKISE